MTWVILTLRDRGEMYRKRRARTAAGQRNDRRLDMRLRWKRPRWTNIRRLTQGYPA